MPWVQEHLIYHHFRDHEEEEEETRRRQRDEHAAKARLYPCDSGTVLVFAGPEEGHAHRDGC